MTGGAGTAPAPTGAGWPLVAVALLAALPTLAWGVAGGGFLTDDWSVWLVFDDFGVAGGLRRLAFEQPARPLAAPYYALLYLTIGDAPVLQASLLAAVNAALIVSAWAAGRRFLPPCVLWPALVVLALAPNHAATRFWFVIGTYPLALAGVLVGLVLLDLRRPVPAAVAFAAATAMYEGVVAFGGALVLAWLLVDRRSERVRDAVIVLAPTAVIAGLVLLLSPKRGGGGPGPFDNAGTFLPGQMGAGLWGSQRAAYIVGVWMLVGLAAALVSFLPSFRGLLRHAGLVLVGAATAVVAAAPYFASGSVFGTTGVFDRNNLVPNVGVALVLGALFAAVHATSRGVAIAAGTLVVAIFVHQQGEDLFNWRDAVRQGDVLVADVAAAGIDPRQPMVIVPEQPGGSTGVADFIYDGDLVAALRYRLGGDWSRVRLIENVDCATLTPAGEDSIVIFDWTRVEVRSVSPAELAAACETLAQ